MSVYHNRPALIATSDATGAVGGHVARRLANAGKHARSIVLDADHDADLPEMEVVEASYRDPASMRRALGGVHTFFMIPVHEAPDRVQQHVSAADVAIATGVKRIAYSFDPGTGVDSEIYTINPDGGGKRPVTDNATNDYEPYWGSQ